MYFEIVGIYFIFYIYNNIVFRTSWTIFADGNSPSKWFTWHT